MQDPANQEPANIEFGRYRLIRKIATGGMAEIWLAIQHGPHGFEKVAVLKLILPELCDNEDFIQMFLDEARLAAGLDHNNVVRIYDFGQVDHRYYLAMEYLPGEDLASLLQAHKRADQPVPLAAACDIIIGAATGLHFAHELTDMSGQSLNVVHRDVSPSNILVTYHGTVKLVDFGIVRAASNITKTSSGTLKGKIAYVSPEQAASKAIDRRADVFALGTVLYELLTLVRPFQRDNELATLNAVLNAPIPPPSDVRSDIPIELDEIVLKAMARDPGDRFQTAAAFAHQLTVFLISRGYVRSDHALAAYVGGMFDANRRLGKLRVTPAAVATPGVPQRTPSVLKHVERVELSPIRSLNDASASDLQTIARSLEDVRPVATSPWKLLILVSVLCGALLTGILVLLFQQSSSPGESVQPTQPLAVTPPPVEVTIPPQPTEEPVAPPVIEPEQPKVKSTKPKPALGKLSLATSPWCEVFLNGKKLGETPLIELPIPAGEHILTLVNQQANLSRLIRVEIEAGQTTVRKVKL